MSYDLCALTDKFSDAFEKKIKSYASQIEQAAISQPEEAASPLLATASATLPPPSDVTGKIAPLEQAHNATERDQAGDPITSAYTCYEPSSIDQLTKAFAKTMQNKLVRSVDNHFIAPGIDELAKMGTKKIWEKSAKAAKEATETLRSRIKYHDTADEAAHKIQDENPGAQPLVEPLAQEGGSTAPTDKLTPLAKT
jgi:hypothetical protein